MLNVCELNNVWETCFTGTKVLAYWHRSTNTDTEGKAGNSDEGYLDHSSIKYNNSDAGVATVQHIE